MDTRLPQEGSANGDDHKPGLSGAVANGNEAPGIDEPLKWGWFHLRKDFPVMLKQAPLGSIALLLLVTGVAIAVVVSVVNPLNEKVCRAKDAEIASLNRQLEEAKSASGSDGYPSRAWLTREDIEFIKPALTKSPKYYISFLAASGSDDAVLYTAQI